MQILFFIFIYFFATYTYFFVRKPNKKNPTRDNLAMSQKRQVCVGTGK